MGLVGHRVIALMGSVTVCAWAGAVYAQDNGNDEENKKKGTTVLNRLVVGAGEEKVAIDTPQAVTVLNQEDIDEEQPTTVGDLFDRIPGINTSGTERVLGETINIRGVGAPETAGDEGRIIINVDGVNKFYEQYRLGGLFTDPELYKRVEVLRGPASSTLYGSGALGGVINFTTKDASDFLQDGQSWALRTKGSHDSVQNGWLGSAILAVRANENAEFLLAGNYRDYGNYKTGAGVTIQSEFEAPSGLAKGTFRFGDMNEQVLRLSYQHWTTDANDDPYAQVTITPGFGTIDRRVTDQTAIISYENPAYDNDWIDLKISASYSNTENEQSDSRNPAGFPNPPASIFQDTTYAYETYQINAQNTIDWTGNRVENHLTFGTQFAHQNRRVQVAMPFGFHPQGEDVQIGFFVQNEFVWDERLTIIPGVRLDFQELNPHPSVGTGQKQSDVAFSPKIAALYKFNDYFSIFGSYAHTERFPTLDEIFSSDFAPPAPQNFSLGLRKERSDNFEAGFAVSGYDLLLPNDSVQLKTTFFYNDIKDFIERIRFTYPQYRNTGRAVLYGGEMEIAYNSDYFFASAGLSLVRGENKITGGNLNTVAPDEISFTLGGRIPDRDLTFGWKGRFVAAQNKVVGLPNTRVRTPGFGVHDIFATWKPQDGPLEGIEANFTVENVFDKSYREYLANSPARGRSFKFSLAKTFGG